MPGPRPGRILRQAVLAANSRMPGNRPELGALVPTVRTIASQCEVQLAAGSWLASSRVLLREGSGATWATARRVAGSCCAGDAEADALVEHGVRANRLVQPPVERIPGYDLF